MDHERLRKLKMKFAHAPTQGQPSAGPGLAIFDLEKFSSRQKLQICLPKSFRALRTFEKHVKIFGLKLA